MAVDRETIDRVLAEARGTAAQLSRLVEAVGATLASPNVVQLDFMEFLRPRPPDHVYAPIQAAIEAERDAIVALYRELAPIMDGPELAAVPQDRASPTEPYWENGFFMRGDARAAYALVATRRPRLVLEIGSGHSTRFLRKAIRDRGLATRLVSIDPAPRAEVAQLADEHLAQPLVNVDPAFFRVLQPGDVLFFDGSHRAFNGSDVPHLFLSVLPLLPPGVLVHVHDIMLPYEYDAEFTRRHYNEQYVLGALLLDRARWRPVLPIYWLFRSGLTPPHHMGGSFWFESR